MKNNSGLKTGVSDVRLTGPALADLRDIRRYITEDNPVAARRFIGEIVAQCETLSETPFRGRERPDFGEGYRGIPFRRYLIVYRVADSGVEILRVLHGARETDILFE
mgnify:CR=1 FL=1